MEEISPTGTSPNPSQPLQKSGIFTKRNIIIVLVSLLAGLGMLSVFIFLNREKPLQQGNNAARETNNPRKALSLEIANYIESQRNGDGSYNYIAHSDQNCELVDGIENCPFDNTKVSTRVNSWTALSHYSSFKLLSDDKYLERTTRDVDQLIKWCTERKGDCLWVLAQLEIIEKGLKSQKLEAFFEEIYPTLIQSAKSPGNSMLAAIESRQLVLAYERTQNQKYIEEAQKRLDTANAILKTENSILAPNIGAFPYFACWTTLATAELARVKNDNQNLSNVAFYLNKANIQENFRRFDNPIAIQPCIETYYILASATGNSDYRSKADNLLEIFMLNFVDSEGNNFIYGEGGTAFFNKKAVEHLKKKYVSISDSSYTAYLLYLSQLQ